MPRKEIFQTTFESSYDMGAQTKHFRFKLHNPFSFQAGQFVMVYALNEPENRKRPYSIASPPSLQGALEFCLNRVEGGFMSNYLCDLKGGETVPMEGPYGKFTIREPMEKGVLFVATGTGIAPFRSQINDLFETRKAQDKEIWLVYGIRYETDILYKEEWEKLAAARPNFHYIQTISRPKTWTGEKGYVQEKIKKFIQDPQGLDVYICGLPAMVEDVQKTCAEIGFPKEKVHFEKYV